MGRGILPGALALALFAAVIQQVGQKHQQHQHHGKADGKIQPRRVLHEVGEIPQIGDGKHRLANDVFIMHGRTVRGVVGVPLGAEAEDGAVLLVGQDLNDPVGGHGILIEHEGDGIPHPEVLRVHALDIEQGAGVISRLHGAGKNDICIQPHQPDAHQGHSQ